MKAKCILSAAAAVFTILSAMPAGAQVSRPITDCGITTAGGTDAGNNQ
jgi:hypothetical protein